jgi:hypothetical protein
MSQYHVTALIISQYHVTALRISQYEVTALRISQYHVTALRISQYHVTALNPAVSVAFGKISDTRIIGGEDVSIEAVPYQVRSVGSVLS